MFIRSAAKLKQLTAKNPHSTVYRMINCHNNRNNCQTLVHFRYDIPVDTELYLVQCICRLCVLSCSCCSIVYSKMWD